MHSAEPFYGSVPQQSPVQEQIIPYPYFLPASPDLAPFRDTRPSRLLCQLLHLGMLYTEIDRLDQLARVYREVIHEDGFSQLSLDQSRAGDGDGQHET